MTDSGSATQKIPRVVVVGVDGSEHGNAALGWAFEYAESVGATLEAVFAWQIPMISIPGAFDRAELERLAKEFLISAVSAVVSTPPVPLELVVAEGDPTTALIKASERADLLVLGSRGRTPFKGLLLGSVSQGCASTSCCPVVIVKRPGLQGRP